MSDQERVELWRHDLPLLAAPDVQADAVDGMRKRLVELLDDPTLLARYRTAMDGQAVGRMVPSLPYIDGTSADPGPRVRLTTARAALEIGEDAVTPSAAGSTFEFAPATEAVLRPLVDGRTVDLATLAENSRRGCGVRRRAGPGTRCRAGRDGGEPPVTAQLALGTYRCQAIPEAADRAAASGAQRIDTAPNYATGRAQDLLAPALAAHPSLRIATKAGYFTAATGAEAVNAGVLTEDQAATGHSLTPDYVRWQIRRNREQLGRERLDLVLLHNPERTYPGDRPALDRAMREAFVVLEEAVAAGYVAGYGIATSAGLEEEAITVGELLALAAEAAGDRHHLVAVQMPVSLVMMTPIVQALHGRGPLPTAAGSGLRVMAWHRRGPARRRILAGIHRLRRPQGDTVASPSGRRFISPCCAECCGRYCVGLHSVPKSAQVTMGVRRGQAADIPVARSVRRRRRRAVRCTAWRRCSDLRRRG
ncbi:aldo/keto reductase [Streptomyces sp. NPDC006259]|uniref:aldo/keto reductase n=1 Tax=Streptomyces sp. NPDC006259 TaxID=3364740 RepID=UPI003699CA71